MTYDCIIVGGGIAGLQAAIQLGRYHHNVLVFDNEKGRSSLCREYHNLLGWPDGVSGEHFRTSGKKQAEQLGVSFVKDTAVRVKKEKNTFLIYTKNNGQPYIGKRLLIATGIEDPLPDLPNIYPCLGKSVYLCPDCDGYEISNKKTIVIGAGNTGASMVKTLSYWTNKLIYINHSKEEISERYITILNELKTPIWEECVTKLHTHGKTQITAVTLESGTKIEANSAFLALRGAQPQTDVFSDLKLERTESKHLIVNERTKETNIPHVWAVGDITLHSELLSIAMGDGAQAAIWIHKSLNV